MRMKVRKDGRNTRLEVLLGSKDSGRWGSRESDTC